MKRFLPLLIFFLIGINNISKATVLWSQNFSSVPSNTYANTGWTRNAGNTYACVFADYVQYTSSSNAYIITDPVSMASGKGITFTFDSRRKNSSAGNIEIYYLIGGSCSFNTTNTYQNGWVKWAVITPNTSVASPGGCTSNSVTLTSEICGGQIVNICMFCPSASSTNWITIDNLSWEDTGPTTSIPTSYSETFAIDEWYGPVTTTYPNANSSGIKMPYHSIKNSSSAYTYIFGSGAGTTLNHTGGGAFEYCATFSTGYEFCNSSNTSQLYTKEINTSGCANPMVRIDFKSMYPGGSTYYSYTFDEDYDLYAPHVWYSTAATGYSWVKCPMNYYFPTGKWMRACYSVPSSSTLKIKVERGTSTYMESVDNIAVLCDDCSISSLTGANPTGEANPSLDTDYPYTVAATTGATYYRWVIRQTINSVGETCNGSTAAREATLFWDAPSGGNPGIVSGQGTQNVVINFGTNGGSFRVMCIPYDANPGTFSAPTNACYAGLGYLSITANSCAAPVVTTEPLTQSVCVGNPVTFTTAASGTATLTYQWQLNGSNISGATDASYLISSPSDLDEGNYSCIITNSCGDDTTAQTALTVDNYEIVGISIAANPGTTICSGASVTFTATPANGGASPSYQWQLNGANVGTNSSTYTNAALSDGDDITCILTSNYSCPTGNPATSNTLTISISAGLAASVSIGASPGTTVCSGTSVTFTATPTNGGATPSYQWQLNGGNVGTNNSTYSNSTLSDNDQVTCIMTSSETCATGSPATSNTITMSVTAAPTASVSISANPGTTICSGTSVTFTATASNGGITPSYQWQLNGGNVGSNSSTYSNGSLANNDQVTCILTSSETCITGSPATSNTLTMTVGSPIAASVLIAANPGTTVCSGTSVTFTATATNGGSSPMYQWQLNGGNVGTNSSTYTNASIANNDQVTCIMTSSESCATGSPATSNTLTMTVTSALSASVIIAANSGTTVCSGTSVTFTATPSNGGTLPSYQWQLNGINVGTNSSTYTNASLSDNDQVICIMTSSETCATGSPATSNALTMTVNNVVTASVTVTANPGTTICTGTSVTFTASGNNGGSSPSYQWQLNGSNAGTNSSTFNSAALSNGDQVTCIMTSNATCVTGSPATSNVLTMSVGSAVTASVLITANPGTTICTGASVIFTANPTNGGTSPVYQWQLNGSNVGSNSSTYSNSSLNNSDQLVCVMTSDEACVTGNPATSNILTMTVSSSLPASVAITANPDTIICAGTNVTFTANATNGGTTPAYQWQLNGVNVGTNSSTYSNSSLSDSDLISCIMTSDESCATGSPATSNTLNITISSALQVSVVIAANSGTSICNGENVSFTANSVNGGSSPSYQWQINGSNVGTNSSVYSGSVFSEGDQVTCQVTSDLSCATGNPATSNTLTLSVTQPQNVGIMISANPSTPICPGTNVIFTASPTNGGANPSYQWQVNGINAGADSSVFSTTSLSDGDIVTCVITSDADCISGNPSTSNAFVVSVTPAPNADAGTDQTLCAGDTAILNATGGGTYLWSNGANSATTNVNPGSTTTYTVTVTENGCSASDNITVSVNSGIVADLGPDEVICDGETIIITASGGTSYSWSTMTTGPSINVSPVVTTTYTVTISNGTCTDSDDITVTVNPTPIAEAGIDQVICSGNIAVITATGTGSFLWSTGDTTQSITVNPLSTTLYTLTVSNGLCAATDNVAINVNPSPVADFIAIDTTIGTSENVIFSDQSTGADNWLWHFGDGTTSTEQNPIHQYNSDGFFTVILVVSNNEGCSDTIAMSDYIHVYGETEIFIPSCFTPNGDSENDVLYVRGVNIDNLDFRIYDQWGIIIFESNDVASGWDGTYKGTPQPVGNYVYRVKVTSLKGDPLSMEGIVSLVR